MNIYDFAMKMELDGKAYYELLSDETTDTGLKTIFKKLAADEQKHYDTIMAMKTGTTRTMPATTILDEAKNLFEVLTKDKTIAGSIQKSLDGYLHAKKIESDSIRFYEDMAEKENNPETKQLLLRIADEEKKHYNIMDNLYDFALEPKYFLEWVEFSNLKEL